MTHLLERGWQAIKTALIPEPVRRRVGGWSERRRQARIAELVELRQRLRPITEEN